MSEAICPGEATEAQPNGQDLARLEGMSDHVSAESEAREVSLEISNQTLDGQRESSDGQALRACEGHTGELNGWKRGNYFVAKQINRLLLEKGAYNTERVVEVLKALAFSLSGQLTGLVL
eukprot:jgi/Botrbrau1/16914/Bobra.0279s0001.1